MLRLVIALLVGISLLGNRSSASAQSLEEFDLDNPTREQAAPDNSPAPDVDQVEQIIVSETNAFRKEENVTPVEMNQKLHATAQYFADYMARTEKYGHTADGQRPSERASQHGYEYCIVSENIAYRYSSLGFETQELAQGFVHGWKTSPGHRQNMLDRHVTETGVAVAHSEQTGNYYAVQMFGRPQSASMQFQVVNRAGEAVEYTVAVVDSEQGNSFDLPPRVIRTHQRCRPTQIEFGFDESLSITAENNVRYTVDMGASGELTVQQESLAAEE